MATAEPMTMGSPFSSPSSPGAHGSQSYLPAYLLGEPASVAHSPSGRLWSSSTGSPPKAATSLNKSYASPQQQTPRSEQRLREVMVGRAKEKAGAPPVQGLLETITSPAGHDKTTEFNTPTGRVPQFGSPFLTPHHLHTPGFSTPSHDLSHLDQSMSKKIAPSPAQIDPFYTQGESIRPDDELDETWITIFGFPPAATSFILQQFSQYGNILKHVIASEGNWMHIHYQSRLQAKKALSKNAKIYGGTIMVGVTPCIDKVVMATHRDAHDMNSSQLLHQHQQQHQLHKSMLETSALSESVLCADRSMNASRNTSMRPLTAAYKAAQIEHQTASTIGRTASKRSVRRDLSTAVHCRQSCDRCYNTCVHELAPSVCVAMATSLEFCDLLVRELCCDSGTLLESGFESRNYFNVWQTLSARTSYRLRRDVGTSIHVTYTSA